MPRRMALLSANRACSSARPIPAAPAMSASDARRQPILTAVSMAAARMRSTGSVDFGASGRFGLPVDLAMGRFSSSDCFTITPGDPRRDGPRIQRRLGRLLSRRLVRCSSGASGDRKAADSLMTFYAPRRSLIPTARPQGTQGGAALTAGQPRLSMAEERDLAERARAGDEDAAGRLVRSHLGFVVHIARRYRRFGLPLNDLV